MRIQALEQVGGRSGVSRAACIAFSVFVSGVLGGCGNEDAGQTRKGAPPPPSPAATGSGAAAVAVKCETAPDPVYKPLPARSGDYCIEASDVNVSFGEGAKKPIGDVSKLFDGGAEVYLRHKADRIVQVKYVNEKAPTKFVTVTLTRTDTKENAFGMFSQLLVGDRDPADESLPKRKDGVARTTFGTGNAYVWKGTQVAEIVYGDDQASPEILKKEGGPVLEALAKAIGDGLDGDANFPESVAALPKDERLELGERFVIDGLFGVEGLKGAVGYYKRAPDKRYRVAIVSGPAADAEAKLKEHASKCKPATACTFRKEAEGGYTLRVEESGVATEWLMTKKGDALVAVGDEPRVMRANMPEDARTKLVLGGDEKRELLGRIAKEP